MAANTLLDGTRYQDETVEDLAWLVEKRHEFIDRGMTIHVHWTTNGDGVRCWRCGIVAPGIIRPTFGATRREAVELMIAKVVARRLTEKKPQFNPWID